jgi:hypothetical protein
MRFRNILAAAAASAALAVPAAASAQEVSIDDLMAQVMAGVEAAGIAPGTQGVFITDASMSNTTGVDIGSNGGASEADADQQGAAMASSQ